MYYHALAKHFDEITNHITGMDCRTYGSSWNSVPASCSHSSLTKGGGCVHGARGIPTVPPAFGSVARQQDEHVMDYPRKLNTHSCGTVDSIETNRKKPGTVQSDRRNRPGLEPSNPLSPLQVISTAREQSPEEGDKENETTATVCQLK
ncbi:hypothetical protein R1flu_024385 [Riccia fluitans]|uniref:Uncharacterized protein n=1 Tax=Riccia fluitans TaxID=41844 RepID=A0ABD1XVL7_9MARC